MEDEPLLHPRQFDDLVLEYLFGDGHGWVSFPNRNPHMNKLTQRIMRVNTSTIVEPFKAGVFCFKALCLCNESLHPVKNKVNLCSQLLNLFCAFAIETLAFAIGAIAITAKDGHNVFFH
jgi:hypothetical protein